MGPRSPLRFGRCRTDVPPDVLQPIFRMASVVAWQAPMVQGLASGSVGSWHEVPRTSLAPSSAWLRLLRGRRPWVQGLRSASVGAEQTSPRTSCGLRSASVGAEQTSPGCLAVSAPLRSLQNRRPPDVLQPVFRKATVVAWQAPVGPRSPLCAPSSALKWGKLNYTDFVQKCI